MIVIQNNFGLAAAQIEDMVSKVAGDTQLAKRFGVKYTVEADKENGESNLRTNPILTSLKLGLGGGLGAWGGVKLMSRHPRVGGILGGTLGMGLVTLPTITKSYQTAADRSKALLTAQRNYVKNKVGSNPRKWFKNAETSALDDAVNKGV